MDTTIPYRSLGLTDNPFPSIAIAGEQDNTRSEYLRLQAKRLKAMVISDERKKSAIYTVGAAGTGKSVLFRMFARMYLDHPRFYPIFVPFPFYGGMAALHNSVLRRIPTEDLGAMLRNHDRLGRGWPWHYEADFIASQPLWKRPSFLEARPANAFERFEALIEGLRVGLSRDMVVLLVDDIEYAWDRFNGFQKWAWAGNFAQLCLDLGSKLQWILSVNPNLINDSLETNPYSCNQSNWTLRGGEVNLDYRFGMSDTNTLLMDQDQEELRLNDLKSLVRKKVDRTHPHSYVTGLYGYLKRPIPNFADSLLTLHHKVRVDAMATIAASFGG